MYLWHEVLMKGQIKRARSDLNRGWSSQECLYRGGGIWAESLWVSRFRKGPCVKVKWETEQECLFTPQRQWMPAGRNGTLESGEQDKPLGKTLGVQGIRTEWLKENRESHSRALLWWWSAKWFDGEIGASKTAWETVVVGIRGEKIETERERSVQNLVRRKNWWSFMSGFIQWGRQRSKKQRVAETGLVQW